MDDLNVEEQETFWAAHEVISNPESTPEDTAAAASLVNTLIEEWVDDMKDSNG